METINNETEPTATASLRAVTELLDTDPEYAKTLGINAQGIAYLHGAAGVLSRFSN